MKTVKKLIATVLLWCVRKLKALPEKDKMLQDLHALHDAVSDFEVHIFHDQLSEDDHVRLGEIVYILEDYNPKDFNL